MNYDRLAIARQTYVEFNAIRPSIEGMLECGERIFRRDGGSATMTDNQRFVCLGGDD